MCCFCPGFLLQLSWRRAVNTYSLGIGCMRRGGALPDQTFKFHTCVCLYWTLCEECTQSTNTHIRTQTTEGTSLFTEVDISHYTARGRKWEFKKNTSGPVHLKRCRLRPLQESDSTLEPAAVIKHLATIWLDREFKVLSSTVICDAVNPLRACCTVWPQFGLQMFYMSPWHLCDSHTIN